MDSIEDFLKKYEGCFVFVGKELMLLYQYNAKTNLLVFHSVNHGTVTLRATTDNFEKVTHAFPERGLYNIDGQAFLFERSANRQWKRGLCNKNSSIQPIIKKFAGITAIPQFTLPTVGQLFAPTYLTISQALKSPNFFSVALSKDLGLTIPHRKDYDALLFFHQKAIGKIKKDTHTLILHDPLFETEVRNYLHETERNVWNLQMAT